MVENVAKAKVVFNHNSAVTATATHIMAVFGDSNDKDYFEADDAMEGDKYISNTLNLPHHLKWTCCINAPLTCAPTPVEALIDHGCPPVLISSKLVDVLSLVPKKLFKPMSVMGAFMKGERKLDSKLLLLHYCRLHIQLPNSVWKARMVNVVICPRLHTDLILRLDFLVRNHIIIDAKLHTVIAKEANYDLLNPQGPKISRKDLPISPWLRWKQDQSQLKIGQDLMQKLHQVMHKEMHALFSENPERFDLTEHMSVGLCIIGAM